MTKLLDVGFGSSIVDYRTALCHSAGHDGVFRGHHRSFIEQDICPGKLAGAEMEGAVVFHLSAELAQYQQVRIYAPPADNIPSGWGQVQLTSADYHWPGQ